MRDDDAGDIERFMADDADDRHDPSSQSDIFGGYSVLSPGVHIVIDGRPVSTSGG